MKKIVSLAFVFFLFLTFSSFSTHKFYVGVFEVDYKSEKKAFQITSRIFIDDIEAALEAKYKKKLHLATNKEISNSKDLIATYFKEKFKIDINNKDSEMVFLALEYEDDVLICYHKINHSGKIKSLNIYNSILIEQFSEQQNLVHSSINGNKNSFLFTNKKIKEKVEL